MNSCRACGNPIAEEGKVYGYAGAWCHCYRFPPLLGPLAPRADWKPRPGQRSAMSTPEEWAAEAMRLVTELLRVHAVSLCQVIKGEKPPGRDPASEAAYAALRAHLSTAPTKEKK